MDNKNWMPLAEVQELVEYRRLTEKQQLFLSTFISAELIGHRDPEAAVLASYDCQDRESARVQSYSMMRNPRILDVLNLFYGKNATDVFLEDVNRAIRNRKLTLAQMQAMILKSRILGIGTALRGRPRAQKPKPEKKSKKELAAEKATVSSPTNDAW